MDTNCIHARHHQAVSLLKPLTSGTITLSALNILAGFDMSNATNLDVSTQRLVEAIKFAYGQRGELADPQYVLNVTELEHLFLEPTTGDVIRRLIHDNSTYQPTEYNPSTYLSIIDENASGVQDSGTSHMVTADESGLVVSLTTTVNLYWGSQIMVPETGSIALNSC
jgi:gamma-glutamyltranspeptidase/glutathione hydrolase